MILGGGPNRIGQGIEFDYCCVHAAVIELDSLADPVRSAAQDHDLEFSALAPLILIAVSRIVIRSVSFKLGCARIDQPISWKNTESYSHISQFPVISALFHCELTIAKAEFFPAKKAFLHRN